MNKKFICFLITGTPITIQTLAEELVDCSVEELKEIAQLLKAEYGITVCKKEHDKETLQKLFEVIDAKRIQAKTNIFENKPNFPIPTDIFLKYRKRTFFPPPKMGKICSKPKGKYRK